MNIQQRKEAFVALGERLLRFDDDKIREAALINPWFTDSNIRIALASLAQMLEKSSMDAFVDKYIPSINTEPQEKKIGVVMAGNIPMVGFHDFLCVLLAGHRFIGKLSSDDPELLKTISEELINIEPGFKDKIAFTEERLSDFDAVIATGSNNTSRYFESYFGKYPHIIRKNRNGLAILTGDESDRSLKSLGEDIFRYFGMGCRNVSKVYVPENYDWKRFIDAIQPYNVVIDHNKYHNNYTYNKTILVLNQQQFYDIGFLLLKEDHGLSSPLSVLHFENYKDVDLVKDFINDHEAKIQCLVSEHPAIPGAVMPGQSQYPELWDYADNIDTMEFLLSLDR